MTQATIFGDLNEELTFKGQIKRYVFKAPDSPYNVCAFITDDTNEEINITGFFERELENIPIVIKGKFVKHYKYGRQLNVTSLRKDTKNFSRDGLISYLSGDRFPGIGAKKAESIVDTLGTDAIDKIKKDKTILKGVKGLTPVLIERVYKILFEEAKNDDLLIELLSLNLTHVTAYKIIKEFGAKSIDILKDDPYILARKISGFGFLKADNVAKKFGIEDNDPRRIKAGILFALDKIENNDGNSYTNINYLKDYLKNNLRITEDIINELNFLDKQKEVKIENDNVYLFNTYNTEIQIAENIKRLLSFENSLKKNKEEVLKLFEEYQKFSKLSYTGQQKEAIINALTNKISIITGGPGTGKTTIIKAIVDLFSEAKKYTKLEAHNEISLVAPTGRAAKRMEEVLKHPASTIHRFLEFDMENYGFKRNKKNPVLSSIVIIDESSMVDIFLANSLLEAIPNNACVIFVGDVDQLPSIGTGNFFKDIIESNKINKTYLNEIYRQAADSNIIKLATYINNKTLTVSDIKQLSGDITKIYLEDDYIIKYILQIIDEAIKNKYDIINDIQVLVPLKKTIIGVEAINNAIQKEYIGRNKDIKTVPHIVLGKSINDEQRKIFYEGDKIIQTENDKKTGIMNGNIGEIQKIKQVIHVNNNKTFKETVVDIKFDDEIITYAKEDLSKIELAYAITIHKSQGCEFPIIIVPISNKYMIMLKKELLYTAVTRTRERLFLLGNLNIIPHYAKNEGSKRLTTLKERIINFIDGNNSNDLEITFVDPAD